MSRPAVTAMDQLLSILDLETLEQDLFRGTSPQDGWQRVFGGQVIGQALVAAQRTVAADRPVHSLHAYFMRPGDPAAPIIYEVDRIRDGLSFATRSVVAIQHGKAIFSLSASFQKEEEGLEYQAEMPTVTAPEDLPGREQMREAFLASAPDHVRSYWERERPIEVRPLSLDHYISDRKLEAEQKVWVRTTGPVPDDRIIQAAILAYLSDMTLLDTALFTHGRSAFDRNLQIASLDHAMWFHRPSRLDDWLLYSMDSPNTNGARGFTRGCLYQRDGTLIASVAQEGLIRDRTKA
ncbi:acyl-CoA thioesterase [Hoeflea sp. BAL378]|uniref:acyl-CoA thioesterase II n=1 Tax=Hoeflea sp. BAL378 TaxID=1547437 RepID=UPI0005147BC2|nr:acyl-CoA thioesterase II [Hoeflea sp. BAL378]KGF67567.1 acyl-CoA thioesterase [Hoeflea sp. BAL378]